jgi:hypothetical protein
MFTLRTIPSDDELRLALLEAFLLADASGGVRPRPREEITRAIDSGHCFDITHDSQICGCSLIHHFDTGPLGPTFAEIGSQLITANDFGLQEFLAAFHLFQIYLAEYYGPLPTVFAVVPPRSPSEHNLRDKTGLTPRDVPRELQIIRAERGLGFVPGKPVLFADPACFSRAFDNLNAWHEGGATFRTPKKDGRILVEIGWFLPELLGHYSGERDQ